MCICLALTVPATWSGHLWQMAVKVCYFINLPVLTTDKVKASPLNKMGSEFLRILKLQFYKLLYKVCHN